MLHVIILAGGIGKRMQSRFPKVLHQVAGRPMLNHVIDTARRLDPNRIVVVLGKQSKKVQDMLPCQKDLHFVLQKEQKGTGHALQQAVPLLQENSKENNLTLVLYGDVPFLQESTLRNLLISTEELSILTKIVMDPSGYGRIIRDEQGRLLKIVEQHEISAKQSNIKEVNTGILSASTLYLKRWVNSISNKNSQKEYYLTDVVNIAAAEGISISSVQVNTKWEAVGVNNHVQKAEVERYWQYEKANQLLTKGVTLLDPNRFDLRGTMHCGQDVSIDVGCIFEGKVILSDGAQIGPYCILKNSYIGKDVQVKAFCHLENVTILEDSDVGPYARLRPGTTLGKKTRIGNFVEIKNAVVDSETKVGHLTYLGDAHVGARVNIGAGTITCNYNGFQKNRTIIEDDAFIGSDTQLIAPVRVGQGSTVGAGTTLTRDVPEGKLTLTRVNPIVIDKWQGPKGK